MQALLAAHRRAEYADRAMPSSRCRRKRDPRAASPQRIADAWPVRATRSVRRHGCLRQRIDHLDAHRSPDLSRRPRRSAPYTSRARSTKASTMLSHTDSNTEFSASAIKRLLNSNSTRKPTRDPRSPIGSKLQRPVRRLKGPSTSSIRMAEGGATVLRVVNAMRKPPRHDFERCEPLGRARFRSTRAATHPGRNSRIARAHRPPAQTSARASR